MYNSIVSLHDPQGTNLNDSKSKFKSLSVESTAPSNMQLEWYPSSCHDTLYYYGSVLNSEMLEGYYLMEQNGSETSRKVIMRPLRRSSLPVLGYDGRISIVLLIVYRNEIPSPGIHPLKI